MIVAIFGMIIFLIGAIGLGFYAVTKAFMVGLVPGLFSLVVAGIVVMLVGMFIESEF